MLVLKIGAWFWLLENFFSAASNYQSPALPSNSGPCVCVPVDYYREHFDCAERSKGDDTGEAESTEPLTEGELVYLFISPKWLLDNAKFYIQPTTATATALRYTTNGNRRRDKLFEVQLVPANQVNDTLNWTASLLYFVKNLTVENDLIVSLCDTSFCFGFIYTDQNTVVHVTWDNETDGTTCLMSKGQHVDHTFSSRREMHFEIRSDGMVGFASSGDPYPYAHAFADTLKPSTGLWLQVCRDEEDEHYELGYMEFSLKTNKV